MSLRSFLERMEAEKQVLHVKEPVSPEFETSYLMKNFDRNGPVMMFEKVRAYGNAVVSNVCGTRQRICTALDVGLDGLYKRMLWAWRSPLKPKIVNEGSGSEIIEQKVDLRKIPILTHFERDAAPYITSAIIHAKSIDKRVENLSVHRLQVVSKDHLAIRLVPRHLYKLWSDAKAAGKDLDVAISIGVHPALLVAASSPVPFGVSEYEVANRLLKGKLGLVRCRHGDVCAPADAELVLEGRISAVEDFDEGPFVDLTGTYDIQRRQPLVEITGIVHRKDYLYEALLPSGTEHKLLMGLPREVLIWESVSKVVPVVHAINLSEGGNGWLHAVISIDKQVDGDGKNAILATFAAHPSLKHVVLVDSDIDVFDPVQVEWAISTRFQVAEDLVVIDKVRGSTLDSSADQQTGLTSKMGLDATRPFTKPKEKFERAEIPTNRRVKNLLGRLQNA